LVSHGRNLGKFGLPCVEVETVLNSGLLSLCNIGYEVTNKGLLSSFVENWPQVSWVKWSTVCKNKEEGGWIDKLE